MLVTPTGLHILIAQKTIIKTDLVCTVWQSFTWHNQQHQVCRGSQLPTARWQIMHIPWILVTYNVAQVSVLISTISTRIRASTNLSTDLICCSFFNSSAVMLKNTGGRSVRFAACEGNRTWRLRSSSREMGSALWSASYSTWKIKIYLGYDTM